MAPLKRKNGSDAGSPTAANRPKKRLLEKAAKLSASSSKKPSESLSAKPPKATSTTKIPPSTKMIRDEEAAFPRGGASILTPLEHKQIQIEAVQDVLFEHNNLKRPRDSLAEYDGNEEILGDMPAEPSSKRVKSKALKSSKGSKGSKSQSKLERKEIEAVKIESLSYSRIAPGSLILGQVSQINAHDIALALPNNLTGYVPLTSISPKITKNLEALMADDESENESANEGGKGLQNPNDIDLSSLFMFGQFFRAYVSSTSDAPDTNGVAKGKKRLELSIDPAQANRGLLKSDLVVNTMIQASVHSVEDHGLIMDLGLNDTALKGFMSSKEIGSLRLQDIREGAVFLCLITGINPSGNIVKLSADISKAGNTKKAFVSVAPTVNSLLPGTAVELLVTQVKTSGVAGKVMGLLDVTADFIHSGAGANSKDVEKRFKIGDKARARIICTFPTADPKKLGISVLDHVLSLAPLKRVAKNAPHGPVDFIEASTILEAAQVMKVEPGAGLFLDTGSRGIPAYVHISRVADGKVDELFEKTGPFRVGSTHRARILGFNPMDGLYLASMEEKILNQQFLRIEDLKVGEIVKGTFAKFLINTTGVAGALVNLADGITGLVPATHLADVKLLRPEKKFKEGTAVTARILSIDLLKRQFRLTLKKSLVNSEAPIFASYKDIRVGDQSPGTLVSIIPTGAVVQFYGNIRGFLPVSEMSEAYIKDPTQHFRDGQVVTVHVLSIDPSNDRMVVSCKDPKAFGEAQQLALKELIIGETVSGLVLEKSDNELLVEISGSGLKGKLSVGHIIDGSAAKAKSAMNKIRVGQLLSDLLVLQKLEGQRLILLTNKSSLKKAAKSGQLLKAFSDLKEAAVLTGFVKSLTPAGIFLQFADGLTGLVPKSQISEASVELDNFGLQLFQSLTATVHSIDYDQRRFILTMKDNPIVESNSKNNRSGIPLERELVNPIDAEVHSIDDFVTGKLTKAKIASVKDIQINVRLAENVQGRIHVSEMFDDWDSIKDPKNPLANIKPNKDISVRVLGVHDARNHRFLPITHRTSKIPTFELSSKPKDLTTKDFVPLSLENIKVGSEWIAFVNNVADDFLWVNISANIRGRIGQLNLSDDISLLNDLSENFPVGSALRVHVIRVDFEKNKVEFSARSPSSIEPLSLDNLTLGMVLPGRITKVTDRNIMVQISSKISGSVNMIDLADDFSKANPHNFKKNDVARVCITEIDTVEKRISLSTRPSKVLNSALVVEDPEITSISQIKVNDILRGFIKNIADSGIFVTLGSHVSAYVRVSDLSDSYIKDWKSSFEIDQLVKGKVIAVDPLLNHIQMSLKSSVIDKDYNPPITFSQLKRGQIVTGKVRKVEDFGVFIVIDGSTNLSGLCHRSEMADTTVEDARTLYEEGDLVKAKILNIDTGKKRINFGLKAKYFANTPEEESNSAAKVPESDDEDADGGVALDVESLIEEQAQNSNKEMPTTKPGLKTAGFDWSGGIRESNEAEAEADSETGESKPTKPKKHKRAELKIDHTGDLDANGPQSVADFERLLLGQPDSSYLWLSYMAFHLQLKDVARAREVAERALRTISITEEDEKLNVWVALLNLENTYGTDETIEEIFQRANEYCDKQDIHERLISIYIQSGKNEKADALFQTTTKKYTQSPSLWLNYATFLMTTLSAPSRARALLPRATQALPAYAHVDITSKFAQLEFKSPSGDAERGRTIFEGILSTWPKKADLWSVWLDLEIKAGDAAQVRAVFGRVTARDSKLKPRNVKQFFKRWLEWEEKMGNRKGLDAVNARAAEYVAEVKGGA
ncbi:MAG: rRNA biogenesis protein rrp5 [Trizodia sp. TS-e1964]|nr:MAG: rRNA biogenesis protein rrp5 [Trizodia sp. TS-e1964]